MFVHSAQTHGAMLDLEVPQKQKEKKIQDL